MLGKLLMSSLNLLLLDEPTNHLDIESCDSFVAALDNFKGAVVIVTHNEMFLHSLANRLVVFKNNIVSVFEGTYQDFLDKEGWEDEELIVEKKPKTTVLSKKEMRQKKSEIIIQKSKKIKPIKNKIEALENDIEKNETQMGKINEELLEASNNKDGKKIQISAKKLARLEKLNEILFDDLETQMDSFEKIEDLFNSQLEIIER
jgi:ATP-binding cassette subfamily F protein 3